MDMGLKGKRALISGSTAGIGFAAASALAAEGCDVIVNGRTQPRVDQALQRLRTEVPGARVRGIALDLASADGCQELFRQVPDVDVLVNNLGIFEPKAFEAISDADWMRFFEVNVLSGVRLSRQYVPGMRQRNWGRVVFISSESGLQIPAEMIHYGMTKTSQLAVSRGLAETCAGTGVTVNAVLPGPTRSDGVEAFVKHLTGGKPFAEFEHEFFEKMRPSSIIQRFATPEEVANLVVYISSPQSSATNGAALRVDGGVVRSCF
jgi:NAD(P)-dependent dehydrogenase (short-subunit alcohol dehydrogenase family)